MAKFLVVDYLVLLGYFSSQSAAALPSNQCQMIDRIVY